jgi:hypothetical protein
MDQDGWRVSGGEPGVNPRGGVFGAQGYGGGIFDGNTAFGGLGEVGKTPCGTCGVGAFGGASHAFEAKGPAWAAGTTAILGALLALSVAKGDKIQAAAGGALLGALLGTLGYYMGELGEEP